MSSLQGTLNNIFEGLPERAELAGLLALEDKIQQEQLFSFADNIRRQYSGDGILLRGIIEFSNFCNQECFYCGLNKSNNLLKRYRLNKEEILRAVRHLGSCNVKTVVLQSGQENNLDPSFVKDIIGQIKSEFDLAITLSLGEKRYDEYRLWRQAGADRYLLKIETSDKRIYESIHKGMSFRSRMRCLEDLKNLGYQIGSGNIIGLPGQTLETIAGDIVFFKKMELDMIGIGPFIPHANTKFMKEKKGNVELTLKTIALTRIVTRYAHIPSTTALGSLDKDYRVEGLKCGANVLMPNFTPQPYRKLYEIYPGKRCIDEPQGACNFCMEEMARSIGRFIDYSKGDSLKFKSGTVLKIKEKCPS